jgi:hypothetical protein
MNTFDKIKKSWWVILSFIMFLNGLGFMYIGFKHNNRNWVIEGITYELPWFFYFIVFGIYGGTSPSMTLVGFAAVLMLISIIRSIWVAVKLLDVYGNNEKYVIKQTKLSHTVNNQNNQTNSSNFACCICIFCIFFVMALLAFH